MEYISYFIKNNKKLLMITVGLIAFQSVGTLLVPFLVANIIDIGIASGDNMVVIKIGIQMLLVALLTGVFAISASYLSAEVSARFGRDIRNSLFEKIQKLSVKDVDEFGTSSLLTRTTSDITNIQQILMMFMQMILPAPVLCIASIALTASISLKLSLIPIGSIIFFSLVSIVVIKKSQPYANVMQVRMDKIMLVLREFFTGVKIVRAFDNSKDEKERVDKTFSEYAKVMIIVNRFFAVLNPAVILTIGLSMVAILWFCGIEVGKGTMQLGAIAATVEYTILTLGYLTMAAIVLVLLPKALACLQRIMEVLEKDIEVKDAEYTEELPRDMKKEVLTFNNVSFSYVGAEEPVLKDLSFTCIKGQTTAIVGGTGSGKSTIAKAILRFKDITSGEILLNGVDIKKLSQENLRNQIGYVPQKAFLFSGNIADNLSFGKPGATLKELEKSAEVAEAKGFIHSLKDGYNSFVAQKGGNFSGGQKQRLSIARALVKKSPIYFFDDSFSALDYKTDAIVRKKLKEELKDKVTIIVAQRISTVMNADQIIVLNDGEIAAKGSHNYLLENCEVYRDFALSQGVIKEENLDVTTGR